MNEMLNGQTEPPPTGGLAAAVPGGKYKGPVRLEGALFLKKRNYPD
jgi:hypothetical protein